LKNFTYSHGLNITIISIQMYSPKQLIAVTDSFQQHQDRIITELEHYCEAAWEKWGTIVPFYKALLYDFRNVSYNEYDYKNFALTTEQDYKQQFLIMSGFKYMHQMPTVFSAFVMPIEMQTEDDLHIVTTKGILMFAQTEIQTKYGIYQIIDGKFTKNEIYSKNFWPKQYMMNMGYLIGIVPTQS
jgi:hypothetical protein